MPGPERSPPKHRIITPRVLVVSVMMGVVLAVLSVPVAAIVSRVHQTVQGGFPAADWQGDIDRADHVELIARHDWVGQRMWGTHWAPKPLDPAWQHSLSAWVAPDDDPRPAFAGRHYPGFEQGVYVFSFGWPFHGGTGRTVMQRPPSGTPSLHDEQLVLVTFRSTFVRFPLRPIWPGLAANAAFYTAFTLGLLSAVRWWRARRRPKQGQCVACRYELGAGVTVCPECGLAAS